jgi:hypothetical protein
LFLCIYILKQKINNQKQRETYLDNLVTKRENKNIAIDIADFILSYLKRKMLIYRPFVSVNQFDIPGGSKYRATGDLIDKSGDIVGTIRLEIFVPFDPDLSVRIWIDWKRDAFGFWYREEIFLFEEDRFDISLMNKSVRMIESTANGSVRLKSMNLGLKKIKNNKIKDEMFSNSMRLW